MIWTDAINKLIKEHGYESYLEIGIWTGVNFKEVKCKTKVGIDPDLSTLKVGNKGIIKTTSDEFFKQKQKFDIIFIDGLHHSDQVERDIMNSYAALNKGGVILVHDCLPWNEELTIVPRQHRAWCGDVFRAVCGFIEAYEGKIKMGYIEEKAGLFLIWKTSNFKVKPGFNKPELSYQEFDKNWRHKIKEL